MAEILSLEQHADEIAQMRGELAQKEEQQEITTLIVDGQLTATGGTAAAPTVITTDTWHTLTGFVTGWSVGNYCKYKLIENNAVRLAFSGLTPDGTLTSKADATTILSAANGLPAGYRPATNHRIVCFCSDQRTSPDAGATGLSSPALMFLTDGSIQCFGIGNHSLRVDLYCDMPVDI